MTPELVVTNAHVVEGCGVLNTPDGTRLVVNHVSVQDDLALLTFEGRSESVLSILPEGDVNLGEQVSALGYPLYGMLNRQLNFTQGVVSAEAGIGDDDHKFSLTAPISTWKLGRAHFQRPIPSGRRCCRDLQPLRR